MKLVKSLGVALGALILPGALCASETPAGLWRTFDSETGKAESLVRISVDADGEYTGVVESLLQPENANARCDQCKGERKGQPVQGMRIISDIRASDEEAGLWDGGKILDVKSGSVYKARMELADGGQTLEVRGFLGFSLIGRTTTFERVE